MVVGHLPLQVAQVLRCAGKTVRLAEWRKAVGVAVDDHGPYIIEISRTRTISSVRNGNAWIPLSGSNPFREGRPTPGPSEEGIFSLGNSLIKFPSFGGVWGGFLPSQFSFEISN